MCSRASSSISPMEYPLTLRLNSHQCFQHSQITDPSNTYKWFNLISQLDHISCGLCKTWDTQEKVETTWRWWGEGHKRCWMLPDIPIRMLALAVYSCLWEEITQAPACLSHCWWRRGSSWFGPQCAVIPHGRTTPVEWRAGETAPQVLEAALELLGVMSLNPTRSALSA